MGAPTDGVLEQFRELLALGDRAGQQPDRRFGTGIMAGIEASRAGGLRLEPRAFSEWRAGSLSALQRVFGENHIHTRSFAAYENAVLPHLEAGQGILAAALRDIEHGYLQSVQRLVVADVFTDFLDMALHLLDNGYKDPAATLIGGVLEDGLRRIATANKLTVTATDNLKSLNDRLLQTQVFNTLAYRQVHAWNALRDQAAHGHFDQYDTEQVRAMLLGAQALLTKYL